MRLFCVLRASSSQNVQQMGLQLFLEVIVGIILLKFVVCNDGKAGARQRSGTVKARERPSHWVQGPYGQSLGARTLSMTSRILAELERLCNRSPFTYALIGRYVL